MDKELEEAFNQINNVLSYSNSEHKKDKTITKYFEKNANLDGGEITMQISFSNLPPKELYNALNELQKFSNTLLHEVIPEDIIN